MGPQTYRDYRVATPLFIGFLILWSTFAMAESANDDDLVKLARKHFNYDSIKADQERQAFNEFFLSVHHGENAKFGPENPTSEELSKGYLWAPDRTVKAEWIMWVCKDADAVKMVQSTGIQVTGAKIDDRLDLSWLKLEFPLSAAACYFTRDINLSGSSLRNLQLSRAYLSGELNGNNSTLQGNVGLYNCKAAGLVSFWDAKITGGFDSYGTQFYNGPSTALTLAYANIGAGVYIQNASGLGEINCQNADITGEMDCSGSTFPVFQGHLMKVSGRVRLNFKKIRHIWIISSVIGSDLSCTNGTIVSGLLGGTWEELRNDPDYSGLLAIGTKIGGSVYINMDCVKEGILSFFSAKIAGSLQLGSGISQGLWVAAFTGILKH